VPRIRTDAIPADEVAALQAALHAMAQEPVNDPWQSEMARFFEGTGNHADQMMEELVEVFHLD
jgi:L-rhamnose mutarotase